MKTTKEYEDKGYVSLKNLLAPEIVSTYLSIMQNAMGGTLETQQRFVSADNILLPVKSYEIPSDVFPFGLALLWGLTPTMESVTGKTLLPSYSWGRIYQKGGLCVVPNDRRANEHSLNLTLGYSDNLIWDFCVAPNRISDELIEHNVVYKDFGDLEFDRLPMNPGDAVAYHGPQHYHGRVDPNPNRWSAHLFLGWVEKDGPQKEHAFEKMIMPPPANFFF